jgi:hypothetical protein
MKRNARPVINLRRPPDGERCRLPREARSLSLARKPREQFCTDAAESAEQTQSSIRSMRPSPCKGLMPRVWAPQHATTAKRRDVTSRSSLRKTARSSESTRLDLCLQPARVTGAIPCDCRYLFCDTRDRSERRFGSRSVLPTRAAMTSTIAKRPSCDWISGGSSWVTTKPRGESKMMRATTRFNDPIRADVYRKHARERRAVAGVPVPSVPPREDY